MTRMARSRAVAPALSPSECQRDEKGRAEGGREGESEGAPSARQTQADALILCMRVNGQAGRQKQNAKRTQTSIAQQKINESKRKQEKTT